MSENGAAGKTPCTVERHNRSKIRSPANASSTLSPFFVACLSASASGNAASSTHAAAAFRQSMTPCSIEVRSLAGSLPSLRAVSPIRSAEPLPSLRAGFPEPCPHLVRYWSGCCRMLVHTRAHCLDHFLCLFLRGGCVIRLAILHRAFMACLALPAFPTLVSPSCPCSWLLGLAFCFCGKRHCAHHRIERWHHHRWHTHGKHP